jgi:Cu-Zn family superoxide dismutase
VRRHPEVVTAGRRGVRSDRRAARAPSAAFARARIAAGALMALAVAGCQTGNESSPERTQASAGLEAKMMPVGGSAANGSVVVSPTGSGIQMRVYVQSLPMMRYRVVIHANGNCSSPNGFSAGPPLVLPGAAEHVMASAGTGFPLNDGALTMVLRIPGVRLDGSDGILGKSVVVHAGDSSSLDAVPGVPNDRVACGVIVPAASLF